MRRRFLAFLVLVCAQFALGQQIRPSSTEPEQAAEVQQDLVQTEPGTLIGQEKIPAGSRVYFSEMPNGFENYIIAGLQQKKVPVIVVSDPSKADFEISGVAQSEAATWAKMLFTGSSSTNETASVKMRDVNTGRVVFAYSVHKANSARGRQSAGEACAKHIKEKIVTAKPVREENVSKEKIQ